MSTVAKTRGMNLAHWRRCVVGLALSACLLNVSAAQNLTDADPQDSAGALDEGSTSATGNSAAAERSIDQLVSSMDNMIPGNLEPDSDRMKLLRAVAELFLQRDLQASREKLGEAAKADSSLPPADLLMSAMLFTVNNSQIGVGFLEEAAKNDPEYPSTYAGFARIALNANRVTDAVALLAFMKQKIEAGSWNELQQEQFETEYLDAISDVHSRRGDFERAKQDLKRLAELVPENGRVQVRIARIAFSEDDVEQAVQLLESAREKSPELLVPPLIISNWFKQQENSDLQAQWMEKASEQFPDDLDVQMNFCEWLISQAQYSKASIWAERAAQNGANSLDIANIKGRIAFIRQQYELAELSFAKIHKEQPANVDAANLLALSLVESGVPNKMRRALDLISMNVKAQQSPNVGSIAVLGWVLLKNGDVNGAGQQLSQLARLQQVPDEASYFLARLLVQVQRDSDALRILGGINTDNGSLLYRTQIQELQKELRDKLGPVDEADGSSEDSGNGGGQ